MTNYIKSLSIQDTSVSPAATLYVDTRTIKDANNQNLTLKDVLDGKQPKLPNASSSGLFLKSNDDQGGLSWESVPDPLPGQWQEEAGKFLRTNGSNAYWESLETVFENTPFKIKEACYNAGSDGTIALANGYIQYTSASTITLPAPPSSGSITLTLFLTSTSVTWQGSTIEWIGGNPPALADISIVNFISKGLRWIGSLYGTYVAGTGPDPSESGRTFVRNAANTGTIMTWNDNGTSRQTVVFDAAYRTVLPMFSTWEAISGITTIEFTDNVGLPTELPADPKEFKDSYLNTIDVLLADTRTNKAATDEIVNTSEGSSIDNAAGYCRSLTSLAANGCDVPTIACLTRIYGDAIMLDALDPTISSYPDYKLTSWNFPGTMEPVVFSSTYNTLDGSGYMIGVYGSQWGSIIGRYTQSYGYSIIPVVDL